MRRLNLISVDELDITTAKHQNRILGQGAFGIVYAGKWKPPGRNGSIPVAIKAINPTETRNVTEAASLFETLFYTVEFLSWGENFWFCKSRKAYFSSLSHETLLVTKDFFAPFNSVI